MHPEWYPGLNANSTFDDFLAYMVAQSLHSCLDRQQDDQENISANTSLTWSYSAQFRYRWSQYYLHSAVVTIAPGEDNKLILGGHEVSVKLPVEGTGSIGLLVGDPCIRYDPRYCKYTKEFQVKRTLQTVLNAMSKHGEPRLPRRQYYADEDQPDFRSSSFGFLQLQEPKQKT